MSAGFHLILDVAIAVAIALIGGLIAHRLHQSVIVGYLLAGVVLGLFIPSVVGNREQIAALAEIGVIFLMFALGIEFSLKELARVRTVALIGTALQIALLIVAGLLLGKALGWPLAQSLFFGGIISISSTMVILKMLLERGEVASNHGRVLLGMLIVQDLAAVVLVALLPRMVASSGAPPLDLLIIMVKALAYIAVVLYLGARVVPLFMARVERLHSPELFLLTAVTLALGAATISALLGLSTALGAFLGGLLLAETDFDHRVIAEIVPMRNLFASLFFVSVGMLIDPGFIVTHLPAVIGLTLFIVSAKALLTMGAVLPFKLGGKTAVFASLGMIQIGEFSYVLASAGRAAGAISTDFTSLILAASVATILLTPAAFQVAPRVERLLQRAPRLGPLFLARPMLAGDEETLRDYAVVVGYGRVGSYVTHGLRESGLPVVVIEEDMHLAQLLRSENVPVIYGDASSAIVLGAAHVERARLVVIALPDSGATREVVRHVRHVNASAPILARIAREGDEEALKRLGVTQVIAPERAGAQLLLESCLQAVGIPTAVVFNEPGQPVLE